MENFSKKSIVTFLTEILVFCFSFGSLVLITRGLGPEGRGIYILILLVPTLILSFGTFGLGSANVYFAGRNKYKVEDVVSNSLTFGILAGIVSIIVFALALQFEPFRNMLHADSIPTFYLWIVMLIAPVSLISGFLRSVICGKGEIFNYNKARVFESFLNFVFIILFIVVFGKRLSGAILAYFLAICGSTLLTIYFIKKISKIGFKLNFHLLKESFIFGAKVYVADVFSILVYRFDMILLAVLLNPAISAIQIGFYSLAVNIAERIFLISGSVSTVLYPKISSSSSEEADQFTPKILRHTLFVLIISCIGLAIFIRPIVSIVFGSVFLASIAPLLALLPGMVALGIAGVIAADLSGRGKPQYAIYASGTCVVVNVILNIIFIPKLGILGAAIASSIGYWADSLVMIIAFIKISKNSARNILVIKKNDFYDYYKILNIFS